MTIQDQLVKVGDNERAALMYAFEAEQPYHVVLKDKTFIGVHLTSEPQLIISQTQGVWSIGIIRIEHEHTTG